jgi:hypothetical protein
MRPTALLFVAISIPLAAACSKPSGDAAPAAASGSAAATSAPTASAAATAPAVASAATPKAEYAPGDLWTEVSGLMRIDVLSHPPVTVKGTVKAVKDDPTGTYAVDLDAGGGHTVELGFADFGKAERAKKLAAGSPVAASGCTVTMPKDNQLTLIDCVLK